MLVKMLKNFRKIAGLCALLSFGVGCSATIDPDGTYPEVDSDKQSRAQLEKLEGGGQTLFGELSMGGPKKEDPAGGMAAVNLYLWRAALETLALGPLESADPFGGIIITDWFTLSEEPGSQFRVTAYILGRSLRTDNIKVAMYVRTNENGQHLAHRATAAAERRLENLILTKARTIRATQYK